MTSPARCGAARRRAGQACAALALAACSPTHNWREVRLPGTGLSGVLPCKPELSARTLPLGSTSATVTMLGCEAGGATYALAHLRVPAAGLDRSPAQVLALWRDAQWRAWQVAGRPGAVPVTPHTLRSAVGVEGVKAERLNATGRQGNGRPLAIDAVWATAGADVYQALRLGERADAVATDEFLGALSLAPSALP